jgi:hypothetical protein
MSTAQHHDAARFETEDDEALVAATFMCPMCLRAPCRVVLEDGDVLPYAACTCASCGDDWTVGLEAHQLLRLSLDPPSTVWLTWGPQARHLQGLWVFDQEELGGC